MKRIYGLASVVVVMAVYGLGHWQQISSRTEQPPVEVTQEVSEQPAEQCLIPVDVVEKIITQALEPWADVAESIDNTVVQLFVFRTEHNWLNPYISPRQCEGSGTAFFISEDGYLITNAHVVDQSVALYIQLPALGKERIFAEVVGISYDRDLALIKISDEGIALIIEELGALPVLSLGDSDSVRRADEVLAVGYPLGQLGLKTTRGVVSGREFGIGRTFIQIDAAINPGSSGGPAINQRGEVIGINSQGIVEQGTQNVGYIIPVNELKVILSALYDTPGKLVRKPYMGLFLCPSSPAMVRFMGNPMPAGPCVAAVVPGSLTGKTGMQSGDLLYSINGDPIDRYCQIRKRGAKERVSFIDYLTYIPIGDSITIEGYRDGAKKTFTFTYEVGDTLPAIRVMYPQYEQIDYTMIAGLVVQPLCRNITQQLGERVNELVPYEEPKNQTKPVLVITSILQDSLVQRDRAINVGSRIDEVNGIKVRTMPEFNEAVKKSVLDGYLRVKVIDGNYVVLPLAKVLQDEPRLASIYRYTPSPVVQELMASMQQ